MLCLKRSVADTSKFTVLWKEKMYKTKITEWHNDLKRTEVELKMTICWLTLYLNQFNESKRMFGRTLNNFFYFFCGIVKLICELRHTFFRNLLLRQILILKSSALFKKNLRSAASKFAYSVVWRSTYAPPPFLIDLDIWSCSVKKCTWKFTLDSCSCTVHTAIFIEHLRKKTLVFIYINWFNQFMNQFLRSHESCRGY